MDYGFLLSCPLLNILIFSQSFSEVFELSFYINVYSEYRLNFRVIIWDKVYSAVRLRCSKGVTLNVFGVSITTPWL